VTARLDPATQDWMREPATREVMRALSADGGEARFVGGAVRNALLGEPVNDVDIATPLLPQEVVKRLNAARLAAVPTGISHGTVTAVCAGRPFEVTTLRRDVSTDGRRATVAFTTDWAEDAARRDFTMNALYAAEDGELLDPTGGIDDLRAGRVRFVGDPATRIREDYLRILRLFRFHAWYGKGALDAAALAAAAAEKAGLKILSGERIQKELLRLLAAADPIPVLRAMDETGILAEIFPGTVHVARLQHLFEIARAEDVTVDPVLALAALLADSDAAAAAASRLKLSNADRFRLLQAVAGDAGLDPALSAAAAHRLIYRSDNEVFRDRVLLRWADAPEDMRWAGLLACAANWQRPVFPLNGRDALDAGVPEGPAVGRVLSAIETWWVEQDCAPDRAALLLELKELLAQPDS
jgi:poly(A) polymerase